MRNILVVYYSFSLPQKASGRDHLYSFRRWSEHNCFYLNLAIRRVPWYVRYIPFDLIVFSTSFCSARDRKDAQRAIDRARVLKSMRAVKIALPQDEFINTKWLCDFINEFELDGVFSVAPESEWPVIYPTVDSRKPRFFRVLTGYLDESTVTRIETLAQTTGERPIDIGYRTAVSPWWGRFGFLKQQLADVFQDRARSRGLSMDISSRREDFFRGDDWYRFLLSCKYALGVEGGASLLDWDGTVSERGRVYLASHPNASFEELEAACFPQLDGSLRLRAITPRHLEACATRTCQILIEGDYNGILKAGQHYIELKRDFSNVDQVLDLIEQDHLRVDITERAYREIVESGEFTYRRFVEYVIQCALGNSSPQPYSTGVRLWNRVVGYWMRFIDRVVVAFLMRLRGVVPERLVKTLRRAVLKTG